MSAEPTQRIIPIGARIQCLDGYSGSVTRLIVDPSARRVTHIVAQGGAASDVEHLVPVGRIAATMHGSVMLDCTHDTFMALGPFAEERYISSNASDVEPFYSVDPFAEFEAEHIPLVTEHIPPGELAIQRDAQVIAGDGPVGHMTAFVVDHVSGDINTIVVRLGHWHTKHEHAIPIAAVERIDTDAVYLALARDQVATLPVMPLGHYD